MLDSKPKTEEKKENLLAQSSALKVYLDSLLHNVPDFEPAPEPEEEYLELNLEVDQQEVKREAEKLIAMVAPETKPVIAPPVIAPPQLAAEQTAEVEQQVQTETVIEAPEEIGQTAQIQQDLRIINFSVGGMKLAVPLEELGGVSLLNSEVQPVANKPHWVKGLIRHQGAYVHVVDTYELIFPPEKRAKFPPTRGVKQYLIFDHSNRWALICDEVSEVSVLKPMEIKWRTTRTSRKWLAGTVINQLCALIDLKKIGQLLEKGRELV